DSPGHRCQCVGPRRATRLRECPRRCRRGSAGSSRRGRVASRSPCHCTRKLPRTDVIRLDGAPLGIAIATTAMALLVFGLLPALNAARASPSSSLRSDTRSGGSAGQRRLRQSLVSSQVALAVVMVAGALLLGRSLGRLQTLDFGYVPERLSLLRFDGPQATFG